MDIAAQVSGSVLGTCARDAVADHRALCAFRISMRATPSPVHIIGYVVESISWVLQFVPCFSVAVLASRSMYLLDNVCVCVRVCVCVCVCV